MHVAQLQVACINTALPVTIHKLVHCAMNVCVKRIFYASNFTRQKEQGVY